MSTSGSGENWEALFNDLEDAPAGHFRGSIICVNNQKDAMAASRLQLIDAQQRFTTISLLFCALYEKKARTIALSKEVKAILGLWNGGEA